jgi:tRNA modification GTPase
MLTLGPTQSVSAWAYWFRAPRSYTGQDSVELHVPGALPLLRLLAQRCVSAGARRALPGEFTARAYLAGKLSADQVAALPAVIHAADAAAARQAARAHRAGPAAVPAALTAALVELLASVEAGIDFPEEQDVSAADVARLSARLGALQRQLTAARAARDPLRAWRPHVALAGLPNAGKSALFNALLGTRRALVAPVIGTTRDVLSAEVPLAGVTVVLQDCAGLGHRADELALAAHLAAERAAAEADVVLWVHDAGTTWSDAEQAALASLAPEHVVVALSKSDVGAAVAPLPHALRARPSVAVSVVTGAGLAELSRAIAAALAAGAPHAGVTFDERLAAADAALARSLALLARDELCSPELVALHLREAVTALETLTPAELDDAVLTWVYASYCVGK